MRLRALFCSVQGLFGLQNMYFLDYKTCSTSIDCFVLQNNLVGGTDLPRWYLESFTVVLSGPVGLSGSSGRTTPNFDFGPGQDQTGYQSVEYRYPDGPDTGHARMRLHACVYRSVATGGSAPDRTGRTCDSHAKRARTLRNVQVACFHVHAFADASVRAACFRKRMCARSVLQNARASALARP